MSDRNPTRRHGSADDSHDATGYRGEARRFLNTPMQHAMIRGLTDEERARAWLGVANEYHAEGELGAGIVERIAEKVREAADE